MSSLLALSLMLFATGALEGRRGTVHCLSALQTLYQATFENSPDAPKDLLVRSLRTGQITLKDLKFLIPPSDIFYPFQFERPESVAFSADFNRAWNQSRQLGREHFIADAKKFTEQLRSIIEKLTKDPLMSIMFSIENQYRVGPIVPFIWQLSFLLRDGNVTIDEILELSIEAGKVNIPRGWLKRESLSGLPQKIHNLSKQVAANLGWMSPLQRFKDILLSHEGRTAVESVIYISQPSNVKKLVELIDFAKPTVDLPEDLKKHIKSVQVSRVVPFTHNELRASLVRSDYDDFIRIDYPSGLVTHESRQIFAPTPFKPFALKNIDHGIIGAGVSVDPQGEAELVTVEPSKIVWTKLSSGKEAHIYNLPLSDRFYSVSSFKNSSGSTCMGITRTTDDATYFEIWDLTKKIRVARVVTEAFEGLHWVSSHLHKHRFLVSDNLNTDQAIELIEWNSESGSIEVVFQKKFSGKQIVHILGLTEIPNKTLAVVFRHTDLFNPDSQSYSLEWMDPNNFRRDPKRKTGFSWSNKSQTRAIGPLVVTRPEYIGLPETDGLYLGVPLMDSHGEIPMQMSFFSLADGRKRDLVLQSEDRSIAVPHFLEFQEHSAGEPILFATGDMPYSAWALAENVIQITNNQTAKPTAYIEASAVFVSGKSFMHRLKKLPQSMRSRIPVLSRRYFVDKQSSSSPTHIPIEIRKQAAGFVGEYQVIMSEDDRHAEDSPESNLLFNLKLSVKINRRGLDVSYSVDDFAFGSGGNTLAEGHFSALRLMNDRYRFAPEWHHFEWNSKLLERLDPKSLNWLTSRPLDYDHLKDAIDRGLLEYGELLGFEIYGGYTNIDTHQ